MTKNKLFIFISLFYFIITQNSTDIFQKNKNLRFCGANLFKYEIKISSKISQKNKLNRKLSTVFSPIRILLDTTYFEEQGKQIAQIKDKVSLLKEAMNKAVKALTDILEVENYGNDIFVDLTEDFLHKYFIYSWNKIINNKNDIPADLIILTKFEEEGQFPQGVLASAMPILLYKETNRPIVGLLTVSRSASFYSYSHIKEYFSLVFLHELTHALGFLESMFPFWSGGTDYILMEKEIRGMKRTLIKTPKVVELAKKYFNCNSIEGLEIEDQGGEGSSKSHWEQRILLGEYMGAVIYQEEMAISEFTLAFLEDSGWYKAKYYTGGLFRFGKNKGCEFIENECLDNNNETPFKNEFFDESNSWFGSCSTGRQSRTYSIFSHYPNVENSEAYKALKFDYNSNNYYGGSIYTADYCPINTQNYEESGYNYFYGSCKFGNPNFGINIYYFNSGEGIKNIANSQLPSEIRENISSNSFCIMTNLVPKGKYEIYKSVFHPMCYEVSCSSKSLSIKINNIYVVCPRSGGNIEVEGFDGYLNCPDYNLICTGTVLCNDIFDCIEKKSLVKNNTYNYDYTPLSSIQNDDLFSLEMLEGYELSNDGICPINSTKCKNSSFYYKKIFLLINIFCLIFLY